MKLQFFIKGAQWLSGRVLDSRQRCRGFEPHRRHCVVVLEQDTFSLVLVQPRKTRPCLTERLLMRRKESNQTHKTNKQFFIIAVKMQFFIIAVQVQFFTIETEILLPFGHFGAHVDTLDY